MLWVREGSTILNLVQIRQYGVLVGGEGVPWDREVTSRCARTKKVQFYGDFPLLLLVLKVTSRWTSQGFLVPSNFLPFLTNKMQHLWPTINIVLHASSLGFRAHSALFGIKDCQTKVERKHIHNVLQPTLVHQWAPHKPTFETNLQFHLTHCKGDWKAPDFAQPSTAIPLWYIEVFTRTQVSEKTAPAYTDPLLYGSYAATGGAKTNPHCSYSGATSHYVGPTRNAFETLQHRSPMSPRVFQRLLESLILLMMDEEGSYVLSVRSAGSEESDTSTATTLTWSTGGSRCTTP